MSLLEQLQSSLYAQLILDREHVPVPGFDAFVDLVRTQKYFSFALAHPDTGAEHLAALRVAYAERDRNARVECFVELNPELEAVLLAAGWTVSERMPVMICTPANFRTPPAVEGLRIERVDADSPDDLLLGFLRAQRVAFRDDTPITPEEVARWRTRGGWYVAGLLGDDIAGTALCSEAHAGVTEVGGVATPPPFRRRGIGAAVTAAAVAAAFEGGAELAWLTAAGESAQGIYGRAGFEVVGTLLGCDAPDAG